MKRLLAIAMVTLTLGGCSQESEPPSSMAPRFTGPVSKPSAGATKVLAADLAKQAGGGNMPPATVDEFNLPLIILIDAPETPPEVAKAAAPLEPDKPEKKEQSGLSGVLNFFKGVGATVAPAAKPSSPSPPDKPEKDKPHNGNPDASDKGKPDKDPPAKK
jgi:hypothetical protein